MLASRDKKQVLKAPAPGYCPTVFLRARWVVVSRKISCPNDNPAGSRTSSGVASARKDDIVMGTYKKEPRCIWHHFRVTEKEEIQIRRDMANADYLSMSKYFRHRILQQKITVEKVIVTDRTIRNQINNLSAQIERIGVNFNQAVRALHSSLNVKRKNGEPLINGRAAAFFLNQLAMLSEEIIQKQNEIISFVSEITHDNSCSHLTPHPRK